jgi:hypothetical protein
MAAINFPNSPSVNQQYTQNGRTWYWDGQSWLASNSNWIVLQDDLVNHTMNVLFTSANTGILSTANVTSTKLNFNPGTGTLTSVVVTTTSDYRVKNNIQVIGDALDIVSNLRGVTFNWNDTGRASAGLIAQDVERYLPQLVHVDITNKKSLNYNGVIGVLVEAIKELTERVKKLENK